jgi:hypothetical protein
MDTQTPRAPEADGPAAKPTWEPPALILLGRVSDLVQGTGKSGSSTDADGQTPRKISVAS